MNDEKSKPNGIFVFALFALAVLLVIRIVQVWYFSTLYLNVDRILNRTETIENAVVSEDSTDQQELTKKVSTESESDSSSEISIATEPTIDDPVELLVQRVMGCLFSGFSLFLCIFSIRFGFKVIVQGF